VGGGVGGIVFGRVIQNLGPGPSGDKSAVSIA